MEMYPVLEINRNVAANRFYAFPIIGMVAKIIILIPVFFWIFCVVLALFFVNNIINSFIVLFTGKYWQTAYNLGIGLMRLNTKVSAYIFGLTDKYPYFSLSISDFKVEMACPENPSRFFAIPLLGGMVRILIIMPFGIFQSFINYAAGIGMVGSFVKVLLKGEYPESTYQLGRDSLRLGLASSVFMLGLSDDYPSFEIDLKNKKAVKFMLIAIGSLFYFSSSAVNGFATAMKNYNTEPAQVQNYNFDEININSE